MKWRARKVWDAWKMRSAREDVKNIATAPLRENEKGGGAYGQGR